MKIKSIVFGIILICIAIFFTACHRHSNPPTPLQPNPASYTYKATLIATHSPGFFSCANFNGRILLGTYAINNGSSGDLKCQLCELVGNQVKILHVFNGESVYHIRVFKDYTILPIEQGNIYRYDLSGIHELKHKTYQMGFYDFCWLNGHNYTLEKKNIYPPNVVAIYKDLHPWFYSTAWKAKDMLPFNGKLYCSATGLNNRTEAGIVEIDPTTKAVRYFKHFRWCWSGALAAFDGAVWVTFDCNGTIYNTNGREWHLGNCAWYIGKIGGTVFATTGGKWRERGPSHLYVFNPVTKQFEKKLDLDTCEPWFMCRGNAPFTYYLVSRCNKENLGKVYLIERK